jgi:ABC-type branched-subunit amino acid transport system substrate-binding protein
MMMTTSLALISLLWCMTGVAQALELSLAEAAGKRLYREGIGVRDAQVSARVGMSGVVVPAAGVPCAGCHGVDGRGRPEGGVRPPDITWRRLSTPYGQQVRTGRSHPPYSAGGVSRAIIEGVDPGGNALDSAMPRFVMSSQDQLNLVAYLKRLEDDADPGVQIGTLRLGTLLPSQGALAPMGNTVAAVLKGALAAVNEAGGIHGRQLELKIVDPGSDAASAEAALRGLAASGEVFALVAPLVPTLDGRMGELLDELQLPLVGSLSLLGGQQNSRMAFEPLPGQDAQLQALAGYAASRLGLAGASAAIVYHDSPTERRQAEALQQRLGSEGWSDIALQPYASVDASAVSQTLAQRQTLFYLGRVGDFTALSVALQQAGHTPWLLAASAQVPADVWQVPDSFSGRLLLAYPFVPSDWTGDGKAALARVRERGGLHGPPGQSAVLQVDAYCSVLLLSEALRQIGRDPRRDGLINALEALHDVPTGLTPLLGFGPGQRLGMSGAHVVSVDLVQQRFELVSRYARSAYVSAPHVGGSAAN